MTGPRPPLSEARLDRMLDRWLGEGPATVADRVSEAALLIVATRRQKRRGFLSRLATDTTGGRLAAAGAVTVVVVAVGFGLWRGSQVIVQPSPSPSVSPSVQPTPTPSPEPTPAAPITLTPFRSEDGFSVSVPAGWMERPGVDCPGLQIFSGGGAPYGYGSMLISYGQPDGSFPMIDAADTCWAESATGLLGLREALLRTGDFPIPAQFGSNHETDLGGEAAWLFVGREFLATDPTFWVVAFHDGRPVVLRLRFSSIDPYPSPITEIVASFQFQD